MHSETAGRQGSTDLYFAKPCDRCVGLEEYCHLFTNALSMGCMCLICLVIVQLLACRAFHASHATHHHALLFRSAGPSGGLELRYRLSEFHAHMKSFPLLAQVISLASLNGLSSTILPS